MRLPRMTIRRWTPAVAAVALLLGAGRLAERRAYLLERAEVRASRADDMINGALRLKDEYCVEGFPERLAAHYASLARKYERAAWRPWLSVEPDPPHPEP
jgi:hypothetical protein